MLIHLPMRSGTIFSPILKKRIFSPILKKRIPRHREAKQHAQGHTAWKGQSLDESPGRLLPEVTLLTSSLCHFSQRFLPLTATQRCGRRPGESLKVSRSSSFLFIYLFIWLHWVLVEACKISIASCGIFSLWCMDSLVVKQLL